MPHSLRNAIPSCSALLLACSATLSASAQITLTPFPVVCSVGYMDLNPYGSPAGGQWYVGAWIPVPNNVVVAFPGNQVLTYIVGNDTASQTLQAQPLQITPSGNPSVNVCPGSTVQLSATPSGGVWSGRADTTGLVVGGMPGNTATYTYMHLGTPMCSASVTIATPPLANGSFSPSVQGPFCLNDGPQTVTAVGPMMGAGTITGPGIVNPTMGTDWIESTFDPAIAGVGIHTLTLTTNAANACTAHRTMDVEVHECTQLIVKVKTDDAPGEISWELQPAGGGPAVCSGNPQTSNAWLSDTCTVPTGCYRLLVSDQGGNGITDGGYMLTTLAKTRLMVANGDFGSLSSVPGDLCTEMGPTSLKSAHCNRPLLPLDTLMRCKKVVGASHYEFWFFDPHGSYSHTESRTGHGIRPSTVTAAPIPTGLQLNVRVRALVNGSYTAYGKACTAVFGPPANSGAMTAAPDGPDEGLLVRQDASDPSSLRITAEDLLMEDGWVPLEIHDAQGRLVHAGQVVVSDGSVSGVVQLPLGITAGVYVVRLRNGQGGLTQRILVSR